MAYDKVLGCMVPRGTGVLGVETLSAGAAEHGDYLVSRPCSIRQIKFYVTTTVAANTTAPVLTFRKRVAYSSGSGSSSSGQSTIGTLTIPDLTAAGKVVYKNVTPVHLDPGDILTLDHTTQAADSVSAAGAGHYDFEFEYNPETPANISDMVASA